MTAQRLIVPGGKEVFFRAGFTYMSAIDKPFILSTDRLVKELEKSGFQVLGFWKCEDQPAPFQAPGKCGDDYDYLGVARKLAPSQAMTVPSQVAWIMETAPSPPPPGPAPPGPAPPGPVPPGPVPPGPVPPGPAPPPSAAPPVAVARAAAPVGARLAAFVVGALVGWVSLS